MYSMLVYNRRLLLLLPFLCCPPVAGPQGLGLRQGRRLWVDELGDM